MHPLLCTCQGECTTPSAAVAAAAAAAAVAVSNDGRKVSWCTVDPFPQHALSLFLLLSCMLTPFVFLPPTKHTCTHARAHMQAVSESGAGPLSPAAVSTAPSFPRAAPAPPDASVLAGNQLVLLQWQVPSDCDVRGVAVQFRPDENADWQNVCCGTASAGVPTSHVQSVAPNSTVFFRIAARYEAWHNESSLVLGCAAFCGLSVSLDVRVCVCLCVRVSLYACVCVCVRVFIRGAVWDCWRDCITDAVVGMHLRVVL